MHRLSTSCIILPMKYDPLSLEMGERIPQVEQICSRYTLATEAAEAFQQRKVSNHLENMQKTVCVGCLVLSVTE